MKRSKHVTSVDKANVLESSRLWREVMHRLAKEYSDVAYEDVLVDNAAMQLVRDPSQFDVVVTENMFGDILSDEASEITGSIGMVPSSSLGEGTCGLYEPIHAPRRTSRVRASQTRSRRSSPQHDAPLYLRSGPRGRRHRKRCQVRLGPRLPDPRPLCRGGTLVGTAEMGRRIAEAI